MVTENGEGAPVAAADASVSLERDWFLRTLIRELAGTLEETVGLEDAAGFVSVVGDRIGRHIDEDYRRGLGVGDLAVEQVADVLVDLKRRIGGDFYLIERDGQRIVLGNRTCPFGESVHGRPSMCMMTSNVFGAIAAENVGYAKVEIAEAIARGHRECRVVVHLEPSEASSVDGREYFAAGRDA